MPTYPGRVRRLIQGLLMVGTAGLTLVTTTTASAASTTATVRTGGKALNVRSGPSANATRLGTYPNGSQLALDCSVQGQYIRGAVRSTSQWDRLAAGGYVSHAYVDGGSIQPCTAPAPNPAPPAQPPATTAPATTAPTTAPRTTTSQRRTTPARTTTPGAGRTSAPKTGSASSTYPGVVTTGDGALRVRTGPSTQYAIYGRLASGSPVTISCQVTGQYIRGTVRSTSRWDRLVDGHYVSHAYVSGEGAPACEAPPTSAPVPTTATTAPPTTTAPPSGYRGTVRTSDGALRIRTGPSTGYGTVGRLTNGSSVSLSCQVSSQYIVGTVRSTSQWDRLVDGHYVSHAYIDTGALPACPPSPAPVVGPLPRGSNAAFIASLVPAAQQMAREYGVPASVTMSQAIIESGWGRSGLAVQDRNYFGIKCSRGTPGPIAIGCHNWSTHECSANHCYATTASFRVYASVGDSIRDHAVFLTTNRRYRPAFSYSRDPAQFAYQIAKAGYATSPTYYATITGVMARYNLYQYDVL